MHEIMKTRGRPSGKETEVNVAIIIHPVQIHHIQMQRMKIKIIIIMKLMTNPMITSTTM